MNDELQLVEKQIKRQWLVAINEPLPIYIDSDRDITEKLKPISQRRNDRRESLEGERSI